MEATQTIQDILLEMRMILNTSNTLAPERIYFILNELTGIYGNDPTFVPVMVTGYVMQDTGIQLPALRPMAGGKNMSSHAVARLLTDIALSIAFNVTKQKSDIIVPKIIS